MTKGIQMKDTVREYLASELVDVAQILDASVDSVHPSIADDPPKIQAWADPFELVIHVRLDGVVDG